MVALAADPLRGPLRLGVNWRPTLLGASVGFDSVVRTGLRRYFSHGNSQSELATPNTTKQSLQPTWAMSIPPRSVPTAGPEASPAPRMRRMVSSSLNPLTRPVPNVAADHNKIPSARTQLTGKRSTSHPETIWKIA